MGIRFEFVVLLLFQGFFLATGLVGLFQLGRVNRLNEECAQLRQMLDEQTPNAPANKPDSEYD